ncbi:MAG: PspC domain-containing protein [Cellulosilyticaceae bacterium]
MEPKKFYKIDEGKKLCGVCGGVAEYFNFDPSIVRILWAVLSLAYGVGVILYIVCAIVLPTKTY